MAGAAAAANLLPMTTRARTYHFPVEVHWRGGRLTSAAVAGKPDLAVATPPVFHGDAADVWSPEDLLVASAASCLLVTLVSVAERRGLPLRALAVQGAGAVTQRPDGRFGFTSIDLDVALATDAGREADAEAAVEAAERSCLVAASLDLPVRVTLDVRAAAAA